jgi:general secretion pathway protein G
VKQDSDLKDAWGNDYTYTVPGQNKAFDLISLGADGKDGGEGENRDITN